MCHTLLRDARLYASLFQFDRDLAERARSERCSVCDGVLHRGDFPRKPRGASEARMGDEYNERFSFCCSIDGCRKRMTPASVRFLGRRVYLGVVVVLVTAMRHGASPPRLATLRHWFGVSAQTVLRWRAWWLATFVQTPFWKTRRGLFMPPLAEETMPACLLAQMGIESAPETWIRLMEFLAPITMRSTLKKAGNSMA